MKITGQITRSTRDGVTTAHAYRRKVPLGTWDQSKRSGETADGRKFDTYLAWDRHVRELARKSE